MDRPPLPEAPYLVVGLARSGLAAMRALAPHGEVIGCDAGRPEVGDVEGELHFETGGIDLLDRVATVVKSPGVPREAPVIAQALERGIDVIGELELGWRLLPNRFVAVTGTNGKTTTVHLLGAMWEAAGLPVVVAGNVGTPLVSLAGTLDPEATVVCEASSFQLEDSAAFAPECAVLLNVEEDHLDRHGTFERYLLAKLAIFTRQDDECVSVAPPGFQLPGAARRVTFGGPEADVTVRGGRLVSDGRDVMDIGDLRLRGRHNVQNALAATGAALAMGVPEEAVTRALREFGGVEHRLEEVATVDGVLYVNDSKATNPASAVRGIEAFEGGVHAILGGSLKGGGFRALREPVAARCRAAYLIGAAAPELASDLDGTVPLRRSETLEEAVAQASQAAEQGDVVLLSPACASFDAFRDYEDRGERFRELVSRLR
jgi:UDP-N-acetylmuramoylalanine--D-glutamate ligase